MDIYTTILPGWINEVIWEQPDVQQILGPSRVRIDVMAPIEDVTPYPLRILVALDPDPSAGWRRYVVTHLEVHANLLGDAQSLVLRQREANEENLFTPSTQTPPVTSSSLAAIRLPPILTRALQQEVRIRRQLSNGEWITGMSEADIVPGTYMLALATGMNPTVAVADRLGIKHSAAAQRVARARKAGALPPTTQGAR